MLHGYQVEQLIGMVNTLDRPGLIEQFHRYQANFPVDFSTEFLTDASLDRLRHIFVAMCLQCQRLPFGAIAPAA
jgi:hypothetical protein